MHIRLTEKIQIDYPESPKAKINGVVNRLIVTASKIQDKKEYSHLFRNITTCNQYNDVLDIIEYIGFSKTIDVRHTMTKIDHVMTDKEQDMFKLINKMRTPLIINLTIRDVKLVFRILEDRFDIIGLPLSGTYTSTARSISVLSAFGLFDSTLLKIESNIIQEF